MSRIEYNYCAVKYIHDPAAGEMLNIGVLVFSKSAGRVLGKFETHYDRLSTVFANFNGEHYRRVVRSFERGISRLNKKFEPALFEVGFSNISEVFNSLVPDLGLSIQFGPVLAGLTADLEWEVEEVFDRLVQSQAPSKEKKSRSDDEIWTVFSRPFGKRKIVSHLQPRSFLAHDNEWKFDHTFKNERWHILEPVTMDYVSSEWMQMKAARLVGEMTFLQDNKEIKKIYLLLGTPRVDSLQGAYVRAKNLLNEIPIEKELIEETEAEAFAEHLKSYMLEHGVIEE